MFTGQRQCRLPPQFVGLAGWAILTVVSTVILTVIAGLLVGLHIDPTALQTACRVAAVGLLSAALTAPMAQVSSSRRGYLPGFVAPVAVVIVTQLVTALAPAAGSAMPRQRCGWVWAAQPPLKRCR